MTNQQVFIGQDERLPLNENMVGVGKGGVGQEKEVEAVQGGVGVGQEVQVKLKENVSVVGVQGRLAKNRNQMEMSVSHESVLVGMTTTKRKKEKLFLKADNFRTPYYQDFVKR